MKFPSIPKVNIPLLGISTDPLDLLLAGLVLRMKQLSQSNAKFIELTHDKQFRIAIGAQDGVQRHLVVNHGQISNEAAQGVADFTIQFINSEYAVKTILSGDSSAFMTGVQDGSIQLEGDFTLLVWFNKVARLIVPDLPQPLKMAYQQVKTMITHKK